VAIWSTAALAQLQRLPAAASGFSRQAEAAQSPCTHHPINSWTA